MPKNKLPIIFSVFLLYLLLCHLPSVIIAGTFSVNLEKGTLSITAENVPLQSILLKLAAEGITVKIDPAINPNIKANFKNRPIEQALESILKPASHSLLWEAKNQGNTKPAIQLTEIHVFQSGKKNLMKTLKPRRTEVITKNKKGFFYVKGEILLYIPPGTDLAELKKLIQSYNGTLVDSMGLPGMVKVLLPENADVFAIAREIKSKLNLEVSQPNYAHPIQAPVHYGIGTTQADLDPGFYAPTDNSVPIAILDSGLDDNIELNKFVISSLDVIDPNTPITDTLGHGTQMAFIASGIVKPYGSVADNESYIPIIPIRAFDDNGYTTDFKIMDSINFALANNAKVLSLSWGSETRSDFMEKSFAYANSKGLIVVASAGNEPTGKPVYPAAYPSVIGVGALGPHGKTWEKSNFGNFVALYAPGFANLPVGHKGDPGLYAGTSISAAFVANTIANYLSENPAATLQEINDYLNKKY
ncbi:MAG: S8/S53 family peptidase [Deltaproteobacteria bacterium]|nr:MAG: S8/S53 family peptidase [Deltaproteobacteria bacterium]